MNALKRRRTVWFDGLPTELFITALAVSALNRKFWNLSGSDWTDINILQIFLERYAEFRLPLQLLFIGFEKAFIRVKRV